MNHIDLKNKTVFITGSAGFIGSNLVLELLRTQSPIHIIGLDNVNDYYDVSIKEWRLREIEKCVDEHSDSTYIFYKDDLANKAIIDKIFKEHKQIGKIVIDIYSIGLCHFYHRVYNSTGLSSIWCVTEKPVFTVMFYRA